MVERFHAGKVIDEANSFEILDCVECGFVHAVALQTIDVYTSHYYDEEKPNYISSNESETEWWDLTYGDRIDFADELAGKSLENWIDIGTGPGLFLDAAKKRNKNILGVEPSKQAASHALGKGHQVINSYFDHETSRELGPFDAAHFSEVLEHVPDPEDFLNCVHSVLEENGLIIITVPNDYNIFQEIFVKETGKVKWWLAPPFHLNYFSHKSLISLVERCGFEILKSTSMFPIDMFLLMGDDYVGDDTTGKEVHDKRRKFENIMYRNNPNLLRKYYESLASLGIGREIVIFARKR